MFKKFIALTLGIVILLSCTLSVMAAKFNDVDEDKYSWAITQINEMADKGIINGYSDGSFKPSNSITKLEAMLLISRILGINESAYKTQLSEIYGLYKEDLDDLNLTYKVETAFLIYKGIFTLSEIENMATSGALVEPLKRYEAAKYLSKTLGYSSLSDKNTGYADNNKIPESARVFVKYVKDQGIMLGMNASDFVPDYDVNRAQMAVMLYRVLSKVNHTYALGTFNSFTNQNTKIKVEVDSKAYSYGVESAEFFLNGEEAALDSLKVNEKVLLVFDNDVLKRVEMIYKAPVTKKIVSGEAKEINLSSSKTIRISDSLTGNIDKYEIADNCEAYVDDEFATLSVIRLKDNVKLYIGEDDKVFRIDISEINTQFKDGVVSDINIDGDFVITIKRDNGDKEEYRTIDDVIVKRNNVDAMLRDINVGDKISLCTTNYNRISRIEVKSEISNTSGVITEIKISKNSSVTIEKNGEEEEYPISNSIKITLDGKECEIYDLRLDMQAKVTTDSGAISKIEVTSVDEVGQLSGKIDLVNTSYGFINVALSSGGTKQVFVSNSTKITADGAITATKTIKNLKVGDYVVIIGKSVNGIFQASTIVVVN